MILLLAVSVSFLIADIDSPRGGVIREQPQNLLSLSHTPAFSLGQGWIPVAKSLFHSLTPVELQDAAPIESFTDAAGHHDDP